MCSYADLGLAVIHQMTARAVDTGSECAVQNVETRYDTAELHERTTQQ